MANLIEFNYSVITMKIACVVHVHFGYSIEHVLNQLAVSDISTLKTSHSRAILCGLHSGISCDLAE
jgi:hypothetical protein